MTVGLYVTLLVIGAATLFLADCYAASSVAESQDARNFKKNLVRWVREVRDRSVNLGFLVWEVVWMAISLFETLSKDASAVISCGGVQTGLIPVQGILCAW